MFFDEFTKSQLASWPLARNNYERLRNVIYRTIDFDGFQIRIQHNPDRIQSAVAKIDEQSIKARACFLCKENIPPEQASFDYNPTLDIRINPYPIFDRHYTVPAKQHIPQLIKGHFQDMLAIAQTYPEYTIFYNGPRSGASAPGSFSFPTGSSSHHAPRNRCKLLPERNLVGCRITGNHNRKYSSLPPQEYHTSFKQPRAINEYFQAISVTRGPNHPERPGTHDEPLCLVRKQRMVGSHVSPSSTPPWQFFAEGDENILFSPGCVDFAGLIISPREKDFNRLDAPLLEELFSQLTLTDEQFENLRFMIYDL